MFKRCSITLMAMIGLAIFALGAEPALARKKPRVGLPLAPCAPVAPESVAPAAGAPAVTGQNPGAQNPGAQNPGAQNPGCGPFAVDPELVALRERVILLESTNRTLTSAVDDGKFQLTRARTAAAEDRRVIADLSARNVTLQNEIAARDAEIARLQSLAEGTGPAFDPDPAAPTGPATIPAQGQGTAPDPAAATRSGPRALTPGGAAAPAASGQASAVAPAKDPGEAALTRARNLLVNEDYVGAEKVLADFLSANSTHVLAADAQYYLGEARYLRGDAFVEAAEAYFKVVKSWPKSTRAPDSFVKLAASLRQLGEKQRACETLVEFGKRYPKAPAAVRTRAASEGRAAGCTP